ncbi:LiaG family protein [Neobacillus jeddahensis]|uniref:LiaG family protein n=1 Tax=Neobacillus jeddahensis TaxID=1461580 RepID=UPI00058B3617|nr:DUF4097 family beta strand repeat-containing protein [Neobacillus jeddahensis]
MKRILILLLIITGLYIIFHQAAQFNWFKSSQNENQATITNDIDLIDMNLSSVSTTIIPEDRKDLKAVYNGKGTLIVRENGDTVEVSIKNKWFNSFSWGFSKKKELKIYIPETYDRNMDIDLGSGRVNFSGQADNPVKLKDLNVNIGSGQMNLKNLIVKRFDHDVSSGNVQIDSLKADSGKFQLSSGKMEIQHYTGPVDATVSSGKLDIQMDKLTDSVELNLSSGAASIDLPKNADFTLNGDKSSGIISCDFPLTAQKQTKHSLDGKHGSGKYKLDLDVSSGVIKIK